MTNKITTTGTVRFMRSEEPGRCICCKGDHHIYCRPVDWDDGKSASRMIENLVASSEEMEGRRLRVTVEVVEEHAPAPEALASITQRAHEQEGRADVAEDNLELARQRIAELEGSATLLTNQRDLWYGKVQDLEAKLATPVRLKKVDSSNVPYAGDGFNAAVDYCADRVRAAGFTVEGDE
ncbi:hypothetical protein HWC14_gp39 [Serratia phage Parlo]|uniref:Ead/Ea22-like family protein n=1 Tax=Serratia phage Parlo TaxID=2557554 RepID=A0A482MG40_9CAUD|nr:hypothetical protein HWC14_gp39 [Serratia phage Parlo]QBQ72188.1 hypothetical protein CPT_Parlo_039 [Serratia phage Parlo]